MPYPPEAHASAEPPRDRQRVDFTIDGHTFCGYPGSLNIQVHVHLGSPTESNAALERAVVRLEKLVNKP